MTQAKLWAMKHLRALSALLLLGYLGSLHAQWLWLDTNGSKVYSDRPPPPDIPASKILRQPAPAPARNPAPDGMAADTSASARALPKPAAQDGNLELRKKQLDEEQAARRKAEEERVQRARAENCERARSNLNTLQSGLRITQVGANGERSYLSDDARAQEVQRVQALMQAECY